MIHSSSLSQWIDYFASYISSDLSWRFPLLIQSVIGTILAIGSFFIPESPRWLLDMDLDDEGMGVLADLHGDGDPEDERAREEFREIKDSVFQERTMGDRSYKAMWKRYRGRVLLAVSAQAFAQLVRKTFFSLIRISLEIESLGLMSEEL